MAKAKKAKVLKKAGKKSSAVEAPFMPTIVEGLAKLVERLEIVERKIDQVNSRISNTLFEIRDNLQQNNRQNASHQQNPFSYSPPPQHHVAPQRTMYQVICADCKKSCEVPFKPGDRPVYCKECFAARKSGNAPASASVSVEEKSSRKTAALKTKKKKK